MSLKKNNGISWRSILGLFLTVWGIAIALIGITRDNPLLIIATSGIGFIFLYEGIMLLAKDNEKHWEWNDVDVAGGEGKL